MPLRNLPTDVATSLAQMIDIRPGQVSSMALTRNEYFGDVLYYLVEGAACVVLPESRIVLEAGQVLRVPAHVEHAVEDAGGEGFKLLQLNARE